MTTEYCTTAEVQAWIGALFTIGASTKPNTTQVTAWIQQKSAAVNSAMRKAGFDTVPATDADDLLEIKDHVSRAVALQTLYTALGANSVPQSSVEVLSGWRVWLHDLQNGDAWLPSQQPQRGTVMMVRGKVYGKAEGSDYS